MTDLHTLATAVVELFRHHSPWLADKLGGAIVSLPVKEGWERIKNKLSSPGGQEAIEKVEAEPEKDRNWDTLKNHLLDALEHDAALRDQLGQLMTSQPVAQSIRGDGNKQVAIINSPRATSQQ